MWLNLKIRKLVIICLILGLSLSITMVYIENKKNKDVQFPNSKKIVNYLCSNSVNDREIGKPGNDLATKYIDNLFEYMELDKVFNGSYLTEFKENNFSLNNVVGRIRGKNNSTAIVFTSHFDAWYNGALDNASGVATVLEIANKLNISSKEDQLNYDIIFCMTNGEMSMFAGSKKFVEDIQPMYSKIYNINIDCVGAKKAGALALQNISKVPESKKLYEQIKTNFENDKIEFIDDVSSDKLKTLLKNNIGVSDYNSFEEKDIPNIHIAQKGIAPLILNKGDKPKNLDYNKIEDLANSISKYIKEINLE